MVSRLPRYFHPTQPAASLTRCPDLYREIAPDRGSGIEGLVACCWATPSEAPASRRRGEASRIDRIVPDACVDLLFRHRDGEFLGLTLAGCSTEWFDASTRLDGERVLGLRLYAHAASLLIPLSREFSGKPPIDLAPSELGRTRLSRIGPSIAAAPDDAARAAIVFSCIEGGLAQAGGSAATPAFRRAMHELARSGGSAEIERLCERADLGPRQLHRLFLDTLGFGPKRYGRILRFQRALSISASGIYLGRLARLAAEAGYHDQSHMARDFLELSGLTPSQAMTETYNPRGCGVG
jgi:AraC-like DNA-binding protein